MQWGANQIFCAPFFLLFRRSTYPGLLLHNRFRRIESFCSYGSGPIDLLLKFLCQGLQVRLEEDAARVGGKLDDLRAVGGNSTPSFRLGRGRNMAKAFFSV